VKSLTALAIGSVVVAVTTSLSSPSTDASADVVLVGAGDIAVCSDLSGAEATAKLLDGIPGIVFTLGDLAFNGRSEDFANCYDPTWGRHKARTRPSLGNHDYSTPKAAGYFAYWGDKAGDPDKGYYSYEAGAWHVVVVNSNCGEVGGCEAGSAQEQWLRADLEAHPAHCTLAYWHHPLFSSGVKPSHALHTEMRPIWQALYEAGAELVVNGHEHNYERFGPQAPDGALDPLRGIREIVAGVGGRNLKPLAEPTPNSEIRSDKVFGVLKLTLHAGSYDWEFLPVPGQTFTDSGTGVCH
jgi:hypothetical protein